MHSATAASSARGADESLTLTRGRPVPSWRPGRGPAGRWRELLDGAGQSPRGPRVPRACAVATPLSGTPSPPSAPRPRRSSARPIKAAGRVRVSAAPGVVVALLRRLCRVPGPAACSAADGLPAGECEHVQPLEAASPRGSARWRRWGWRSRLFHCLRRVWDP